MSQIGLIPFYRAVDTNGNPLASARLYTFLTGTTTPQAVYTTEALSVSHGAYVQADANGLFPAFYPDPTKVYRYQLRVSPYTSAVTGCDADPVTSLASSAVTFLAAGTGAVTRTVQDKLRAIGSISPTDYSNLFTGASARAIATIISSGGVAYTWTAYQQTAINIEPGLYTDVAAIGSESLSSLMVRGDVPGTVTLDRSNKTDYFFQRAGGIYQADVRGINVFGGKGLLRHSLATANVQAFQVYEDDVLLGYTECGISSDSINMPYWKLNRVLFRGTDTSIGFALAGFYDASSILDCEFHNGKYGLKVVGDRSSTLSVERTSFFTIRPGSDLTVNASKQADIWIGPSPTPSAAGAGTFFRQIRFGNENMSLDKPRVLIADEDTSSGTSVANHPHKTTDSTGSVDGLAFVDSCIFGNAGITAPFIRSYTPNVSRFRFENNYMGAPPTYLIEYMPVQAAEDTYRTRTSIVRLMAPSPGEKPFQNGISNGRCIGVVEDLLGVMQWDATVAFNGVNDQTSYVKLLQGQGADGTVTGTGVTTSTVTAGFLDCRNVAEVTVTSDGNTLKGWYRALATVTPNVPSRLEICLKQGDTLSLDAVQVVLFNTATSVSARFDPIPLSATGIRHNLWWTPPVTSPGNWRLIVYAIGYAAGTKTKFQVADHHVHHGRSPINSAHIFTAGGGGWDQPHIVAGANHIWVDSGNVYVKTSAPTSGTDGTRLNLAAMAAQADTVAADLAALKVDFNALLAKLRSSGRLSP